MFNKPAYRHDIIKKCVSLFGSIFSGLVIERIDNDGIVQQVIEVPVSFGSREKWMARLQEQPDLDKKVAITLPRIGFEMTSINYDATRKIQSLRKVIGDNSTTSDGIDFVYSPVPYNLGFEVYIVTKNLSDALNLVEQIVPFFTPGYVATINMIPEVGVVQDIPIVLNGINFSDSYDGSFDQKREIMFTLSFTMKAALFGPVEKYGTILATQMKIQPSIGTVGRQVNSTANLQSDGSYTITDEAFDIDL